MPGPKTHDICYKELKDKISSKTLSSFPHYDNYNIFAQGHDFLIYHNFYKIWNQQKLNSNIDSSVALQEYGFPDFVYNYLKTAINNGSIEEEQVRLFIGPGYIMHHLLDAYTHPYIIYKAGDHTRDPKNDTWHHGIIENLIDIYLMQTREEKNPKTYEVHNDFKMKIPPTETLIETLDKSLRETYQIRNGGKLFQESFEDTYLFMKLLKYDPYGIKKITFDILDPILKGTSSFSYHREIEDPIELLNLQHTIWTNPADDTISSNSSFIELYEKTLQDGSYIINELETICQSGRINKDDIYSLIPNISSVHGLESGKQLNLKYRKHN